MNNKRLERQKERARTSVTLASATKSNGAADPKPKVHQLPRLAAIRVELGFTQQQVAEQLGTTQQAVGRWEKGTSEPTLAQLRDLAMMFGCAVTDLMGRRLVSGPIPTTEVTDDVLDDDYGDNKNRRKKALTSGYWGHVGILLHGEQWTKWYPVTRMEVDWVYHRIQNCDDAEPWLTVTTLSNRELVVNTANVQRVWFRQDQDTAGTHDPEDWYVVEDAYPQEFYLALAARHDRTYEMSSRLKQMVQEFAKDKSDDEIYQFLHATTVHFANGYGFSYVAFEPGELYNFSSFTVLNGETGPSLEGRMLNFRSREGWESFVAPKKIALIEIPLIELVKGDQEVNADLPDIDEDEDEDALNEANSRSG